MIDPRNKFKQHTTNLAKSSCLKFALAASVCLFPLGGRTATNPNPTGSGNNFYFTPFGSQLDDDMNGNHNPIPGSDNIYDIMIGPGVTQEFELFIANEFTQGGGNWAGFPANGGLITNIQFGFEWDVTEYVVNDFLKDNAVCTSPSTNVPTPGKLDLTLNGCNINATNGAPVNFTYLGSAVGITVKPGLAPHDGERDFKVFLKSITVANNNYTSGQFQDVELQYVPGPLPLIGVGAAFGFSRSLRKRIKTSKSPEVMSALG
jgi:hypothetical protein